MMLAFSLGMISVAKATSFPFDTRTIGSKDNEDVDDPLGDLIGDVIARHRYMDMINWLNSEHRSSYNVPFSSDLLQKASELYQGLNGQQPSPEKRDKRVEPGIQVLIRLAIMRRLRERAESREPIGLTLSHGMRFKKGRDVLASLGSKHSKTYLSGKDDLGKSLHKTLTGEQEDAVRAALLDMLKNRMSFDLQGMRAGR